MLATRTRFYSFLALVTLIALGFTLLMSVVSVASTVVHAQTIAPSARGAGMGGAYGAVARGAIAPFYNPANLGLEGNSAISILAPTFSASAGTGPVTLRDIYDNGGRDVSEAMRAEWLQRITEAGSFDGSASFDVAGAGLSFGPVAFNVASIGAADASLTPEIAQLILEGPESFTSIPSDEVLAGGRSTAWAASVASFSVGHTLAKSLVSDGDRLSFGVTGKYIMGHGYGDLHGAELATTGPLFGSPSVELTVPMVVFSGNGSLSAGTGFGADVGLAYASKHVRLGVAVNDVTNSFRFSLDDAHVKSAEAYYGIDGASSGWSDVLLSDPSVSDATRERAEAIVADARFRPAVRISSALTTGSRLTLAADYTRQSSAERTLRTTPVNVFAAGLEARPMGGFLPLRGGVMLTDEGHGWTLGTGLELIGINLNAAYGQETRSGVDQSRLSVGLGIATR